MSSNHLHIQGLDDSFFRTEELSERCMDPYYPPSSPAFIASLDQIDFNDLDINFFSLPTITPDMQLPADPTGLIPAWEPPSNPPPVPPLVDGDAYFDIVTGTWVSTQLIPSPLPEISPLDPWHSSIPSPPSFGHNSSQDTSPCSSPHTPSPHECPKPGCSASFDSPTDLMRHRRAHNKRFACRLCNKAHADQRALNRHLWTRHKEVAAATGAKSEKAQCRVCGKLGRADNMRRHERTQHGIQG